MTRFDFKKWVTENKHGKKPLFEQERRRRRPNKGGESPTIDPQASSMVAPPQACGTQYNVSDCHVFHKCVNGSDDLTPEVYAYGGGTVNPGVFWSQVGQPSQGDVVEITTGVNMGDKYIYYGNTTGGLIDISVIAPNPGVASTCTPPPTGFECTTLGQSCTSCAPVDPTNGCYATAPDCQNNCQVVIDGCTDMNATNFDPTATNDDGTCFYGYNCRKQNTPQDIGFKKGGDLGLDPRSVKSIREWVGIGMCYEAAAGTTGTFPDLASCRNSCGPIAWEEPWEKMPA